MPLSKDLKIEIEAAIQRYDEGEYDNAIELMQDFQELLEQMPTGAAPSLRKRLEEGMDDAAQILQEVYG